ncbi:hypothetical protein ACQPXM_25120 [Kribbella sp. CA-253562]|uniref:hypothetical protein n=1 Tax=Kribbella sp. CA-253562 TaxID=3239942 RepID=UPI003D8EAD3E
MEPVSLVVAAVVAGAMSGLTDTATQVVKDAYAGLKRLLSRHDVDVAALERRPESEVQKAALEENLTDALAGADPDAEQQVLDAAQTLISALREAPGTASEVVGVDLARIETEFIRVQEIRSTGTGFRGHDIKATGGIDLGVVEAGTDKPTGP